MVPPLEAVVLAVLAALPSVLALFAKKLAEESGMRPPVSSSFFLAANSGSKETKPPVFKARARSSRELPSPRPSSSSLMLRLLAAWFLVEASTSSSA